ncbi:unnamed protein product [Dibothriocephalus latus]|uniref:Uncharacterized protein n=1 Tax=Dibothriocephalus latus TaxID=60516 RepID=A0A3P7LL98_DIBLA|nr:unnamed protein product [Dibothriocephalus latus]
MYAAQPLKALSTACFIREATYYTVLGELQCRMSERERCIQNRRLTVAPTSSSFHWRDKTASSDEGANARPDSDLRHSSFAADQLTRVSRIFSIDKTRDAIRVALQDSDRIQYTKLACEHEELTKEMKRLKGFVAELAEKYESARSLDPVRRYRKLQSMATTIVLNLRLTAPDSVDTNLTEVVRGTLPRGDVLQSSVKQREMKLKHERACSSESYLVVVGEACLAFNI